MKEPILYFILAESALESIPVEFRNLAKFRRYAKKQKKSPETIVFDKSIHSFFIDNPKAYEKRGRPDIVHISLLSILGTPLCKSGYIKIFVHTLNDFCIQVDPNVRLPRNYVRFLGLMSQLFTIEKVPPKGPSLLAIHKMTLKELHDQIKPKHTIIFSKTGKEVELNNLMRKTVEIKPLAVIVGGFPHGQFEKKTLEIADEIVSISRISLDAHVAISRVLYSYEVASQIDFNNDF
ncbi:MAG: 16S rRNA methyltransferase [Promethearchaeota archaeon]